MRHWRHRANDANGQSPAPTGRKNSDDEAQQYCVSLRILSHGATARRQQAEKWLPALCLASKIDVSNSEHEPVKPANAVSAFVELHGLAAISRIRVLYTHTLKQKCNRPMEFVNVLQKHLHPFSIFMKFLPRHVELRRQFFRIAYRRLNVIEGRPSLGVSMKHVSSRFKRSV